MKSKLCVLLTVAISLLTFTNTNAAASLVIFSKPADPILKNPDPLASISANDFLKLTPKTYEQLTGKKMDVLQKMEFKMMQHKIKKMVRKGEVVTMADVKKKFEDDTLMNVLGFLLGVILGPIGVIIVLILKESGDMSQRAFHWSLIGLLIWLVWFLLVIF